MVQFIVHFSSVFTFKMENEIAIEQGEKESKYANMEIYHFMKFKFRTRFQWDPEFKRDIC